VIKLVIAGPGAPGAIEPVQLAGTSQRELEAYAKQLGVASVIVVAKELVGRLSAEIESALRLDQDGVAQALIALRALKRHAGHGLWIEPPLLDILPAPGYDPIQRT
jgi:hypothetical protein